MKKCRKCGVERELTEFNKCKSNKDGLQSCCKICAKEYYINNSEQIKEYYKSNSEQVLENKKEYYKTNVEHILENRKEYYKSNSEILKKKQKEYYKSNSKQVLENKKEYYKGNSEHIKDYQKVNAEHIKGYRKEYQKERRQKDPLFKLRHNISSLIRICLRKGGYTKRSRTSAILGCTFEEFKLYIEKQFTDGMTWDNRHLWHLDHIYPVSLAANEQHLLQLNHYSNFQPLWAEDNLKKSNKLL
ncbi:MAG: hypothetical protein PHG08_00240 [Bacilli bacterium]|nr:hypothetical protein [Bacilli bacterium]